MKTFKSILSYVLLLAFVVPMQAQTYIQTDPSEQPNFYKIRDAFKEHWEGKTPYRGSGYNPFKRWEWYWETRVYDDGSFPPSDITLREWEKYAEEIEYEHERSQQNGNWVFRGPSSAQGGYHGLGRVNCIGFHPTDINTFWVGTPAGGLWKTVNNGQTWTTNTDQLPVLGVTDIAIDRTNPNIMYIATGDGFIGSLSAIQGGSQGDTKSVGVLKSNNGGQSWNQTGLNWNIQQGRLIGRLIINPNNTQILMAATSAGIWRTSNGGNTWTMVQSGYFMDLEFKPGDPNTVYASTFAFDGNTAIFRSTNSGSNWTQVASLTGVSRINLAVTPAQPNLVDAVCANTEGGLSMLIYSNDSGANFSVYFNADCSNNLLGWAYNASGCGGQGYYDLAYAINPTNANDIWLGGVNTWNSKDGGSTWRLNNFWIDDPRENPNRVNVVHADKHFIAFHPLSPNTIFECNDGGIYISTNSGQTWRDISNGLGISQMYRIGVSQTVQNNIICGLQDNGTKEIYNNQWYDQTGGDGMECIIDYTNANIEYASYANGVIYRTFDFWQNQVTISQNIPGGQPQGAWVTPYVLDPVNPMTIYAGYSVVYRSNNRGNNWQQISPVLSGNLLRSLAVAPSSSSHIYAASFDTLFFTRNGGTNWFFVPANFQNAKITYIAVHPTDPMTLWISLSGYNAGNKVFRSTDGGVNWTNISGTLPNIPVNCIAYQRGSNGGLYIGTDLGVFYRNNTMSDWIRFQNGLPNVVVTELEISYNDNKLWAATYGRGLWNSDLFQGSNNTNEETIISDIQIYPNPAVSSTTVQCLSFEPLYFEITDMNGKKVSSGSVQSTTFECNLANLSSGMYLLQVFGKNTGEQITKKLIKE
jgi:hypothetical protein